MKLLFVHGWGLTKYCWRFNEEDFAGYDKKFLDLPSHGLSKVSWDRPDIKKLRNLINEHASLDTIAIGWSLGGQGIISSLAEGSPFKAIILISSTPAFTNNPSIAFGKSPALVSRMIRDVATDYHETMRRFYRLNFTYQELSTDDAKNFIDYTDTIKHNDLDGIRNSLSALNKLNQKLDLRKIEVPTLLIHGTDDEVTNIEASRYMAGKIKNSRLVEFEQAGHAPFITQKEKFINTVEEFLKEL